MVQVAAFTSGFSVSGKRCGETHLILSCKVEMLLADCVNEGPAEREVACAELHTST